MSTVYTLASPVASFLTTPKWNQKINCRLRTVSDWKYMYTLLSTETNDNTINIYPYTKRYYSLSDDDTNDEKHKDENSQELSMENLYSQWTIEDDRLLHENCQQSTIKLASLLGRGLRGVELRLAKLVDVNSFAYQRLFVANGKKEQSDLNNSGNESTKKLIPASEVIRRIRWDHSLQSTDFSILHYDRIEDKIMETSFTAPNTNISGKATVRIQVSSRT
jgi:MJ1316 RNA cyclic group end recognition domain